MVSSLNNDQMNGEKGRGDGKMVAFRNSYGFIFFGSRAIQYLHEVKILPPPQVALSRCRLLTHEIVRVWRGLLPAALKQPSPPLQTTS